MAQYGSGEQYVKEGHHSTEDNPLQSTTVGHQIGGTGTNVQTATHGHEQAGKHDGGILHRSGSGSSSSSEDDGEGGRRKKKGVVEKIKEKLPGGGDHGVADGGGNHGVADEQKAATTTTTGDHGVADGHVYEGEEGHEKKGLMEKIKEKLTGVKIKSQL